LPKAIDCALFSREVFEDPNYLGTSEHCPNPNFVVSVVPCALRDPPVYYLRIIAEGN